MQTIIFTENGNETVNGQINFRVQKRRGRKDLFSYTSYNQAIERKATLERIFSHSEFQIVTELK
jgi:hypothetical protein